MKSFLVSVLLFCSSCLLKAQEPMLLLIKQDGKFGYINLKGEVVIPPTYDDAWGFENGLAWVEVNDRQGYINSKNQYVILPQYESISYSHGIFQARRNDSLFYINRQGRIIYSEYYTLKSSRVCVEGYIPVKIGHKWGLIDTTGKVILEPIYDQVSDVSEGLVSVDFLPEGKFFEIYNEHHDTIFTRNLDTLYSLPSCYSSSTDNSVTFILNLKGEKLFILDESINNFFGYREGLAVASRNGVFGFLDKKGNWAIAPAYAHANDFYHGYAVVGLFDTTASFQENTYKNCNGESQFYYDLPMYVTCIDSTGKPLNKERYSKIYPFINGRHAVVQLYPQGKYGVLGTNGKYIAKPVYDKVESYYEGLAAFRKDSLWGFINEKGKVMIPATYDAVGYFQSGYCMVKVKGKWGCIDAQGKMVLPTIYEQYIYFLPEQRILGFIEGKYSDKYWWLQRQLHAAEDNALSLGYVTFDNIVIWKATK